MEARTVAAPADVDRTVFSGAFFTIRVCLVLAIALLGATDAAWAQSDERVERIIPFRDGGRVELKNFSGRVRIIGTDRPEVAVRAVRHAPRDRLRRGRLDIRESGTLIQIVANHHERTWRKWLGLGEREIVETDFEIEVPRHTDLDVKVFSSPVEIRGVRGDHDIRGFSSRLSFHDVAGAIHARVFSGRIDVALAGSVDTPELELDTFSGDIEVRVGASATGNVEFRSVSGRLASDYPLLFKRRTRRHLSAVLNAPEPAIRIENDLRFSTVSGDVLIRR